MTEQEERELNERLARRAGIGILGVIPAGEPEGSLWGEIDMTGFAVYPNETKARSLCNFPSSLDACFKWLLPTVPGVKRVNFRTDLYSKDTLTCEIWWDNTTKPEHRELPTVLEGRVLFTPPFPTEKDFALALCLAVDRTLEEKP